MFSEAVYGFLSIKINKYVKFFRKVDEMDK